MREIAFALVDVFGSGHMSGNPLAVVCDASTLSTEEMQRAAAWLNLSETTFVVAPEDSRASYRVRIFDPIHELGFAGHPSLGTAHALLEREARSDAATLRQETLSGLQELRIEARDGEVRRVSVQAPAGVFQDAEASLLDRLADALRVRSDGIDRVAVIDVGVIWAVARLRDAEAVRSLRPDMHALARVTHEYGERVEGFCLFGATSSPDSDIEVRTFAPAYGVPEDPVCGSGNAAIAVYRTTLDSAPPTQWVAAQGSMLGRNGRVHVRIEQGRVWVGGDCRTVVRGVINFPDRSS